MSGRATPLLVRVYRVLRAILHLLQGLATITFVFPWVSAARRDHLIRRWSGRLLHIFAMTKQVHGHVHHHGARGLVLVANHVSWIDIFVINALQPARFIAKAELARWPLIGWLIRGVGTLFIDRSSRRHLHEANRYIVDALRHGDVIAIFPEGAVMSGKIGPFHGSLLQPVIDHNVPLQPVAIHYEDTHGAASTAPLYADLNFMQSVWRMTRERSLKVRVTVGGPIDAADRTRRELAAAAREVIRAALE